MVMSYVDICDHLDKIVGKSGKERESVDIRIALDRYPDLVGYRHHTNEILLCSSEVNPYCTDVIIQRYGEEFVATPFIEDAGIRLHTNPVVYYLGLDNANGFGIVPFAGWEEHLVDAAIPTEIIKKISDFLNKHQPANY